MQVLAAINEMPWKYDWFYVASACNKRLTLAEIFISITNEAEAAS